MPLKRAVLPLLDETRDRATQAQAANTVVLEGGRRTGHNTDVPGVVAAVRERHEGALERAVVLGGGATAASAALGLADLGCSRVTFFVREESRAAATAATVARHPGGLDVRVQHLGSPAPAADIVVSTIPAAAQREDALAVAARAGVVFDVVYDPWPTPLARFAMRTGRVLVSGLDLLVHQAVLQVELMTGVGRGPLGPMRAAGERALAERASSTTRGDPAPQRPESA
jgi:shikimate dehydrogenase